VARSGRMDMQCQFFLLGALVLFLRAESREARAGRWLAGAGLGVGLAGVTHPLAAFWALGLGLVLLISGGEKKFMRLLVFACCAGLPVLIWLAYALQSPEQFSRQFLAHGQLHLTQGNAARRVYDELARYPYAYRRAPLLLAGYVAGIIWLMFSPSPAKALKQKVLALFLTLLALNSLVMVKIGGFYYLHTVIFMALAAGAMFDRVLPARIFSPGNRREAIAAALFVLLILNELGSGIAGRYLALAYQWKERDYQQVEQGIAQAIPQGSVVFGPAMVWYAVEKAGAKLHVGKVIEPSRYDYVVLKGGVDFKLPDTFIKVGEFGTPLPRILGKFTLSDYDYRLQVWKSRAGPTTQLPTDGNKNNKPD